MQQVQPSTLQQNGHWIVLGAVIALGLSVAFYLYSSDKYSLTYFGDSVSHMVGARKLVDWGENPGLAQVGTVWLPLPHFLLLPFTLIDPLFSTGFAGTAVSLPSLAITSSLLYKMIRRSMANGSAFLGFVGAFLYASNPNILYMGITAMTEAPFMLFFVASAYFFLKWYQSKALKNLLYCSIFISLATLCRYEGWVLPLFFVPFVTFTALKDGVGRNSAYAVLLSLASVAGMAIWLGYNAYNYNDPFEFANAQYYSAASQALNRPIRETLFLQPANVLSVYGITAFFLYGPILSTAALAAYVLYHKRLEGRRERGALYVFLVLPPIFTLVSLLIGIGEMSLWFNSRFLILLSPLVVLLASLFLRGLQEKGIKRYRKVIALVVGALFVFQLATPSFAVATYLDARGGFLGQINPFAVQAGEALGSMYDGGTIMIMTGSAQAHRIMITAGIPLKQYDDMIESSTWKKSFYEPWLYNRWIVISKEPDSDGVSVAKYWQDRRGELEEHYRLVYENKYYEILVLK